jgi:chromosome segregation and condensation protein ScpB
MKLNKSYLSFNNLNTLAILAIQVPEISSEEIQKFHRGN